MLARAAGQTVSRQVAGEHGKIHAQRPVDHMPVQAHMIVIAMQQQQGALRLGRRPQLHGDLVAGCIEAAETVVQPGKARGQVETVEAAIRLQRRQIQVRCGQGSQQRAQVIGLKRL